MNRTHLVVVGDVVLDRDVDGTSDRLCPDAPVPVLDVQGMLETAGRRRAGRAAVRRRAAPGHPRRAARRPTRPGGSSPRCSAERVERARALGHDGPTRRKTRVRSGGQSLLRLDEGGPGIPTTVPAALEAALATADAVLVSDYGAGLTHDTRLRSATHRGRRRAPVVWDPHPRGAPPAPGATLATPNLSEARGAAGGPHGGRRRADGPPGGRSPICSPAGGPCGPCA